MDVLDTVGVPLNMPDGSTQTNTAINTTAPDITPTTPASTTNIVHLARSGYRGGNRGNHDGFGKGPMILGVFIFGIIVGVVYHKHFVTTPGA